MWGTDLTSVMTGEGQAAVFVAVDCQATCQTQPVTTPGTQPLPRNKGEAGWTIE
jgi:hypothetical protein